MQLLHMGKAGGDHSIRTEFKNYMRNVLKHPTLTLDLSFPQVRINYTLRSRLSWLSLKIPITMKKSSWCCHLFFHLALRSVMVLAPLDFASANFCLSVKVSYWIRSVFSRIFSKKEKSRSMVFSRYLDRKIFSWLFLFLNCFYVDDREEWIQVRIAAAIS